MSKLFLRKLQDDLYWVLFFFSWSSLVLMKAVFKACIWIHFPEAIIPFTASKTKCHPRKETKLQLPFPILCVCFLLPCLFQRKNAMKCGYSQSNMKHRTTEIQNGSSSTSGNFFLLPHPEGGHLPFIVHRSVLSLYGIPKIPDCLLPMTSTTLFRPLGCFPSSATLHLPVPGVTLFSLRFLCETQAP